MEHYEITVAIDLSSLSLRQRQLLRPLLGVAVWHLWVSASAAGFVTTSTIVVGCRGLYVSDDLVHVCWGSRGYALHGVYSGSMQFVKNAGQYTIIQRIDAIYTHMQGSTPSYSGSMQFTSKCMTTHHQLYSESM